MIAFLRVLVALCAMLMLAVEASAHEVRPAYLEITQTAPSTFDVVWKQPLRGGERLKIDPVLPEACVPEGERRSVVAGVLVHRWQVQCDLRDGALRVDGLDRTLTDVFVRIEREGEATLTAVLRAANDTVTLAPGEGAPGVSAYFRIGVEHILEGYDHLLFVVGLMLLVRLRQLIPAITAFTLAHSITLGASAMAGISLPGPPVEITIALSIAFLASEAIGRQRGRETLAVRRPWTVAFGIGLVHGFGFAGALSEIGLPEGARLMALLLFNLGVEAGQLAVVAAIVALAGLVRLAGVKGEVTPARLFAAYTIGTIGMFWAIERVWGAFIA